MALSTQINGLIAALVLVSSGAMGAPREAPVQDPYQWLESVDGEKQLAWARQQSARAQVELAGTPAFDKLQGDLLTILDSDAKIPAVTQRGDWYYNFWRDREHPRGLWRRTRPDEYRTANPRWETLLDLDALNATEGQDWVWHGADCLRPDQDRCLIALSHGGADADVTREFDIAGKRWVKDGFYRPASKGGLGWIDRDNVYVFTDFGPGSLTSSGYPRIVKRWRRGTPLGEAQVVYEGRPEDMYIQAYHDPSPGYERDFVRRALAFYNDELYLRRADGALVKLEVPNSAIKRAHRQWLTLQLRDSWQVKDRSYPAGALLAIRFDDFMAGDRKFDVLFAPGKSRALQEVVFTRSHVVVNVLEDVKSRLALLTPGPNGWSQSELAGAARFASAQVEAVDDDESDALWLWSTDYLTPTTLSLVDMGQAPVPLKSTPAFFDASRDEIEQNFAISKDGTRIPYFLVRPKELRLDGDNPTLLTGYGGFEVPLTPIYSPTVGKAWLERGGVYVVANIRGGGEYGPSWHQAGLKADRHRVYEDFAAVARDLISRRITSPAHLGVRGRSNGGLLAGNMLTQYPELFGALVIQAPLLDMRRYTRLLAGASWAAEYGDPDSPDWAFIKTFSPYQLFDARRDYPPALFLTSTRDDRVHPAHARKMYAKMLAAGKDVRFYENTEGGHSNSADNRQTAHMEALAYSFLWQRLKSAHRQKTEDRGQNMKIVRKRPLPES